MLRCRACGGKRQTFRKGTDYEKTDIYRSGCDGVHRVHRLRRFEFNRVKLAPLIRCQQCQEQRHQQRALYDKPALGDILFACEQYGGRLKRQRRRAFARRRLHRVSEQ